MGMRAQLATTITTHGPDRFRVITSLADVVPNAGEVVVQLERTSVKRLPEAPLGQWQAGFNIWVVIAGAPTNENEDRLDDALDELLEILDAHPWLLWEQAERTAYDDDFKNAFKIPATLTTKSESSA